MLSMKLKKSAQQTLFVLRCGGEMRDASGVQGPVTREQRLQAAKLRAEHMHRYPSHPSFNFGHNKEKLLQFVSQVVHFVKQKEEGPSVQEAHILRVKEEHIGECAIEVIRAVSIKNEKLARLMLKNWKYIAALQSKVLAQAQIQEEMRKRVRKQIDNVNTECNGRADMIEKQTEMVDQELDAQRDKVTQAMIDEHKLRNELKVATERRRKLREKMTSFVEGDDPDTGGIDEADGHVVIDQETGELDIDGYIEQNMATVCRVDNLMSVAFGKLEQEGGRALGVVMPLARAMLPVDARLREMNDRVYKMMNPMSVRRRNFGTTVKIEEQAEAEAPMALPAMPPYDAAHDHDPKLAKSLQHSWIPYDILSRMSVFPKETWGAEQIRNSNGDGRDGPRLLPKKALFKLILQFHLSRLEDDRGRDRGGLDEGASEHEDDVEHSSPASKGHGKKHKGKKSAASPSKSAKASPAPAKPKAVRGPPEPRLSPGAYLYQYLLHHYGLRSLADQNCYQLLCTCLVYYTQFKRVKFFSDLIGLRPDSVDLLQSQLRAQKASGKRGSIAGLGPARRTTFLNGGQKATLKKKEAQSVAQLKPSEEKREDMKNTLEAKIVVLASEGVAGAAGAAGAALPGTEGEGRPQAQTLRRFSVSSVASDFSDDDDDDDDDEPELEPCTYEQWHLIFIHDFFQTMVSQNLFTKAMLKDMDSVIELPKDKAASAIDTLLRPTYGDLAMEQLKKEIRALPPPSEEPARIELGPKPKEQNLEQAMAEFQEQEEKPSIDRKEHNASVFSKHMDPKKLVDIDDLIECVVCSWSRIADGWCEEMRRAFLLHARWYRARKGASYQEIDPRKGVATGSGASGGAGAAATLDSLVEKGMALPLISYVEFRKTISELIKMDDHTVATLFYAGTEDAQKERLQQLCTEWKAGYVKLSNNKVKERQLEIQKSKHAKAMKKARGEMKAKRGKCANEEEIEDPTAGSSGAMMAVMRLKAKQRARKAAQASAQGKSKDAASGKNEAEVAASKGWDEDEDDGIEWLYQKEDTKEDTKVINLIGAHRAGYSMRQGAKLHTHEHHYGSLSRKHHREKKGHHHHHKTRMLSMEHPSSPKKGKKKKREVVVGTMRKFYYNRELRTIIWDSPFAQDLEGPTAEFGIDVFINLMMTRGVMQRHAKVRLRAKQAKGRLTGWLQQRMLKRKGQEMMTKLSNARFVTAVTNAKDSIFTEFQAVEVRYRARHKWYKAKIVASKEYDLYDVEYDDGGDLEMDVHKDFIRRIPEEKGGSSSDRSDMDED
jgi:hypothetical protein